MKKILLTGGSGFIGRNLRESFLKDAYELVAPSHAELDLVDTQNVDEYFRTHEFDVVLHAAVKPGHRNAPDHSQLFYTNVRMFENLARQRERFGKLINFGSGAIYDVAANNAGVSEEDRFRNMGKDEHSLCKYVVAKRIEELPGFIDLNIFGIFGKYEDYSIRFISNAICKSLFGLPITLRQNRRFSYLDVNNLPEIIDFFIKNDVKYHSYNIVPDGYISLKDIAQTVSSMFNVGINIENKGYGFDYYGNNKRLRNEFSEVEFTPIEVSINHLCDYYRSIKDKIDISLLTSDR